MRLRTPNEEKTFVCRMPDYDETWEKSVKAWDAEEAARKFVEQFEGNDCDYSVAEGKRTVTVQIDDEWFEVSGEIVAQYSAKSIKPPTSEDDDG